MFCKLKMVNSIYLECYTSQEDWQTSSSLNLPLESLTTLFVYNICKPEGVCLHFIHTGVEKPDSVAINIHGRIDFMDPNDVPWVTRLCMYPVVFHDDTIITGLCAVARHICKHRSTAPFTAEHQEGLLGFRKSSLQAPNEVSIWTKFCEVELLKTVCDILNSDILEEVPLNMVRYENHMGKPVKMHNIYKLARDLTKLGLENKKKPVAISNENESKGQTDVNRTAKPRKWKSKSKTEVKHTNIEDLNLSHQYAEGVFMTLADIILYPLYQLIFKLFGDNIIQQLLPLTHKWFLNLTGILESSHSYSILFISKKSMKNDLIIPATDNVSLYKCDPKRHNPKKRLFTKEDDIENALSSLLVDMELNIINNELNIGSIKWNDIPDGANPAAGHLPDVRMARKTQQLENLALAVLNVASEKDVIVDFCSGSGHLGILLAYLLPKCTVLLLENKEQSLLRARKRVHDMGLKNVLFYQCNLDFFIGKFDVGVALHACGIASDLVLDKCLKANAKFVLCPCCYGSLHATDRLVYPRSAKFGSVPIDQYLCIGHAADQTHEDHPLMMRGARCMAVIDSDRGQLARELGYQVTLSRLSPLTCTPKNNLLIGVPS